MTDRVFLAYSDPGSVPEEEFHDWYDNEHLPARLTVPGFNSAVRYRAADGEKPPWLAVYEIEPGTLESPAYKALYEHNSDREKSILKRLATLDRRVYEPISDDRPASRSDAGGPGQALLVVTTSSPPDAIDDMNDWYVKEHIPMLLAVPGWRRVRRYRQISGSGPEYLSLHDVDSLDVFETDAYKAATSTPWRDRVVARATVRERRVFSHYKSFG